MTDWTDQAACATAGPDLWFPDETGRAGATIAARARAICAACPVARECLDYALDNSIEHGVWGGLTPRQRRGLDRGDWRCPDCARSFGTRQGLAQHRSRAHNTGRAHGSIGRYQGGCRCDACRATKATYMRTWRSA